MSRTGLKTFVYSFCISLFTIFLVNGIYWHTHSKKSSDLKISNKNIVLFLKDSDKTPTLKAVPVKKIALSVLPEIEKEPQKILLADASDILSSSENEIIMADELNEIDDNLLKEPPLFSENLSSEKVIDDFDALVQMPPVNALKLASLEEDVSPPDVKVERITKQPALTQNKSDIVLQIRGKKRSHIPLVKENEVVVEYPKEQKNPEIKTAHLLLNQPSDTSSSSEQRDVPKNEKKARKVPLQIDLPPKGNTQKNIVIAQRGKSNMVALADKDIPIKSMESGKKLILKNGKRQNDEEWKQMSDSKEPSSPWVVAKSAAVSPNHFLKNEKYYNQDEATIKKVMNQSPAKDGHEVQVAAETVQNLLIPIPEEIMNEENIVPQLESGKDNGKKQVSAADSEKQSLTEQFKPEKKVSEEAKIVQEAPVLPNKEDLLASLGSIFGEEGKSVQKYTKDEDDSSLWGTVKEKIKRNKKSSKGRIMPTEMRLSFQPNRAEISGQTLRWIQAFAKRTAEDKNAAIEIRIDGTNSMELQQKRLNLLHNILTNKGVSYGKINTVFTNREPNSFIIRTISLGNDTSKNNQKGTINRNTGYYLQW